MILYIILTYLVNLGMMIGSHEEANTTTTETWFIWLLSPITCPIIIGMVLTDKQ